MSQPNTDFIGQIPIAAIITLLASLRDLDATDIKITTATDTICANHPVTTTSIAFRFSSATVVVPDTRPPSPVYTVSSDDETETSEVIVEAASANAAAPTNAPAAESADVPDAGAPGLTPSAACCWCSVTVGTRVGVYQGWDFVRDFVEGVPGSQYMYYRTKERAVAAFQRALANNEVILLSE